jgi:broad specificity phosphatase PhoE
MKRLVAVILVACGALFLAPPVAHAQKVVFIVRHAERADGGVVAAAPPGTMQAPADPPLSSAGEARAQKLAAMLAESGITSIFVTEFHRTEDTAKPLALKLGLTVEQKSAADTAGLIAALKSQHANDVVLIVAHSNTIAAIVKALGGPDVAVGDNDYDNIFMLVPASGTLTRIKF